MKALISWQHKQSFFLFLFLQFPQVHQSRFVTPQQTFVLMKISSRRLEDVFCFHFQKSLKDVFIKANVLASRRMTSRRLQDFLPRRLQDVFKTFTGSLAKTSSRYLQDVLKTSSRHLQDVLQRCLQDALKTYHQVTVFLTLLREVFDTFLRRTAKAVIYRRICLGHTYEMVSVQNLQE